MVWLFGVVLTLSLPIYLITGNDVNRLLPFGKKHLIRVGVLHSLTGTMAISEKPVVDATLLAIDEINDEGGINGNLIEAMVVDGKSDPEVFRREALRLIQDENIPVIFGCWTSASRMAVKPVVEAHRAILFYPVQYEGLEESPNVIYMGAAPNQQLIPAVTWSLDHLGKRMYLVGSDYVFPRVANEIAKEVIRYLGGEVVGVKQRTTAIVIADKHGTIE